MTTSQKRATTHQQPPSEISIPDPLALRQALHQELDRLLNAWQRASGREYDDLPHLDVDAVIRHARLALYDNSATPYEIVLFHPRRTLSWSR